VDVFVQASCKALRGKEDSCANTSAALLELLLVIWVFHSKDAPYLIYGVEVSVGV
jgi:hypothetical protein